MLKVDELLAKVREAAGADDLGDPSVEEGLDVLVDASNSEAGEPGWAAFIVSHLANRLRIVDYAKRHPGLLDRPIEAPIFVFGLPRTGNTLLINLLNADPAKRSLLRWEALSGRTLSAETLAT